MKSKIELVMKAWCFLLILFGGMFVLFAISSIFFPEYFSDHFVSFFVLVLFFVFWCGVFFVVGLYVYVASGQWWRVLFFYLITILVFVFSVFRFGFFS